MKNATLIAALALPVLLNAQTEVTINTAPQNADQVWYRLSDDQVTAAPLADWDLGFEITGFTASILVNTAKGDLLYNTGLGIAAWEELVALDLDNWNELHNSETSWSAGALTAGADGEFNLGWGTYNMVTHVVAGTELYVVQLADGTSYKKLRIDALAGGAYAFTYADLDGSSEQAGTVTKTDYLGKNFGYWDLTANAEVDREPLSADWDLLFTKYKSYIMEEWYPVAGVVQNIPVQVAQLDGVDAATVDHSAAVDLYGSDINIIGSDWKSFVGGAYEIAAERAYFVRAVDGAIWKLIFTNYGGGTTGTMTFTKELMSATGVAHITDNGTAVVYPNPVSDGALNILIDMPVADATMDIHDLSGKLVFNTNVKGLSSMNVRTFDIGMLPPGAYLVRFTHAKGVATTKLIVE